MEFEEDIFFELKDGADKVRIDFLGKSYADAEEEWDKNWLKAMISVQAGAFQGKYKAEFMTIDFEKFRHELKELYDTLNGTASFTCLEDYLELKIKGDGIGHFAVDCTAVDSTRNSLEFELSFDQTQIPYLLKQLNKIILNYPVIGLNHK